MGTLGRPAARAPINTGDIPDGIITSAKVAADVLTAADIAPNAVTASELANDAVDTAAIAADAVDGTKIADNAINSEHYTDASIDTAHIGNDQIDSQHYAADSIDAEHYAAGSVDATAIANDAVDSQHYAADSIDAEHYAAGSVDATAIANDAVDSQHYAAGSIDNEHIADDAVGTDELANDVVINTSGKITTTSDYLQRGTPAVAWDSVYKTISNGTGWAVGVYDGSQDVRMCNNLYYGTSQFRHAVGTNPASIIQQNNNGVNVSFSPSTAAGTAAVLTTAIRIDADGLKFNGDSAAVNALDDYEEGYTTFSSGYTNEGGGTQNFYSGNTMYNVMSYTKIGRQVTVQAMFIMGGYSGADGKLRIGLPFTVGGAHGGISDRASTQLHFTGGGTSTKNYSIGVRSATNSYMVVQHSGSGSDANSLVPSSTMGGNGNRISFSLTYFTDQ
jgi:hypothetical protein